MVDAQGSDLKLYGDFLALISCILGYCWLRYNNYFMKRLNMGIFVYYFPYSVLSAVYCVACACLFEGIGFWELMSGFVMQQPLVVVMLGIGPGLFGLTLMTYCQKHVDLFVLSVVCTLEPLFASVVAAALGVRNEVTWWTLVGGAVLIFGNCITMYGNQRAKKSQEQEETLLEKETA